MSFYHEIYDGLHPAHFDLFWYGYTPADITYAALPYVARAARSSNEEELVQLIDDYKRFFPEIRDMILESRERIEPKRRVGIRLGRTSSTKPIIRIARR